MPIALKPGELREIILDSDATADVPSKFYVKVPSREQESKFLSMYESTTGLDLMHTILEELWDSWKDWYLSDGTPVPPDTPIAEAIGYLTPNDSIDLASKAQRRGLPVETVEKSE